MGYFCNCGYGCYGYGYGCFVVWVVVVVGLWQLKIAIVLKQERDALQEGKENEFKLLDYQQ